MKKQIFKSSAAVLALSSLIFQSFYPPAPYAYAEEIVSAPAGEEQVTVADAEPVSESAELPAENTELPTEDTQLQTGDAQLRSEDAQLQTEGSTVGITETESAVETESVTETETATEAETVEMATISEEPVSQESVSQEGDPSIVSGESVALANILNMVNANFINSDGVILFSNFFDFVQSHLDLRNASAGLFDGVCSSAGDASSCSGQEVAVNVSNDANIDNSILVSAITGQNAINGGDSASIETGDAYAGLNLVNIANTNFVDTNYLLVTLNAFQGVEGDVVFPSLSNFFQSLSAAAPASIELSNEADVSNDLEVAAETGDNSVVSDNGSVTTGSSQSSTNVFNQINATAVGGSNVFILFKVHGDWVGEIFGAPDNLKWAKGLDGSIFLFDDSTDSSSAQSGEQGGSSVDILGSNDATIKNNVSVIALTGENNIVGSNSGSIKTGNALAGLNLVNIANSNIIGRNWIMAVINIFGDFKGNIAFGRPDLWVGEQIEAPAKVTEGSVLNYKFSVINNGDSPATQIKLKDEHDWSKIQMLSSSHPYESDEDGNLIWNLGTLPAGKAVEVSYNAKVTASVETNITNTVSVSQRETDNNLLDNSDTVTVRVMVESTTRLGSRRRSSSSGEVLGAHTANFAALTIEVLRTNPFKILADRSQLVTQTLRLRNPGDSIAKSVKVMDTLEDSKGRIIHDEIWDLGDILPNEEIEITYDLSFAPEAEPGFYKLFTSLKGENTIELEMINNGMIYIQALPGQESSETVGEIAGAYAESLKDAEEPESAPAPVVEVVAEPQTVEKSDSPKGGIFSWLAGLFSKIISAVMARI